ncbi:EamA family transporter [Streptomyces sp. NP160]|uniref:EamA family transporter n=1 Tax=Streptomyces sp. NP160 TaxID=2586637 RepID=UPI00111B5BCF|nr:EamA family transporter [Streptomyces sp. NP160]TNM64108.1 EamA family transporter [Streptomyces sp. NP160]
MSTVVTDRPTTGPRGRLASAAVACGAAAMAFVGGSTAVSGLLSDAPLATAQAVRYGLACLLLLGAARLVREPVRRPRGREWLWLGSTTAAGLLLFNVALVRGAAHAEPAVFGVAVASVPLVLALLGPVLEGRRPTAPVVTAAGVVTAGAALVTGVGRADGAGVAWAVVVLFCEVGFTLLAVPVLAAHGPWGVSVHTTWLAAVGFGAAGLLAERPWSAGTALTGPHVAAVVYLAVGVTAVAFVLWFSAVRGLGSGRAGLLTGVAPVAAAAAGVLLGGPVPAAGVWVGTAVVGLGLVVGLRASGTMRQ